MAESNNKNQCPVNSETREWLEDCFLWFIENVGREKIKKVKVLTPNPLDFPIKYNGENESAISTMKIIAKQMELNSEDILLDIYTEGQSEINTGGVFGNRLFLENVENENYSGGLYFGMQTDNKYHIAIEKKVLKDPISIVATLAHEIAHIKLLGEKRIKENNEDLTDLMTIVYGLGIFSANVAFQMRRDFDSWSWSKSGYLSQMEWGYGLALFAHIRGEKDPEWKNFLSQNIKSDFEMSMQFINNNPIKNINSNSELDEFSDTEEKQFKTFKYNCNEGELSIEQEYENPNIGEKASLNDLPAPTGKYKISWFTKINIINGKVAK